MQGQLEEFLCIQIDNKTAVPISSGWMPVSTGYRYLSVSVCVYLQYRPDLFSSCLRARYLPLNGATGWLMTAATLRSDGVTGYGVGIVRVLSVKLVSVNSACFLEFSNRTVGVRTRTTS